MKGHYMTQRFQACIGPSANKVHIRDLTNPSRLVMCCSCTAVRNYKGALAQENLCVKCAREFFARGEYKADGGSWISSPMSAESIGVRELLK